MRSRAKIVTLTKSGNYLIIRIPKEVERELKLEPHDKMIMTIENNTIKLKKIEAE